MPTVNERPTFRETWNKRKWEWLVALLIAVLAIVIATCITFPQKRFGYAYDSAGNPITSGYVCNSLSKRSSISVDGRFQILDGWGDGCVLRVYSEHGELLGELQLIELSTGEFDTTLLKTRR